MGVLSSLRTPYLASPMTLSQFNTLPDEQQLALVYAQGAYVATRWQEAYEAVLLYQLPGCFFVELTYDTETNVLVGLRSFHHAEGLEEYAAYVRLPDWLLL